jgi:hypothetical protein
LSRKKGESISGKKVDFFVERQRRPGKAKMASRMEAAEGARGPSDARSKTGCAKTGSYMKAVGDLAPVYQEEGGQGQGGPSRI